MFDSSLTDIFTTAVVYAVPAVIILGAVKSSIFTNHQQQECLITRFNKHVRTVNQPGLAFKVPFIDKVAQRIGMDVIQASETLQTKTKDDLFVDLPISVQYEIFDSAAFVFKNRDAKGNMMKSVSAAVRTETSGKDFQELYTDRDELSASIIEHVKGQIAEFGINLRRIIIDEPTAPQAVQQAFNNVRASERAKEAAKNNAEANRITVVAQSLADAEAQSNAGKGAAQFRKEIFDGYKNQIDSLTAGGEMSRQEALAVVSQAMVLDALRDVASKGNLIIVPQDFNGTDFAKTQALKNMARSGP